MPRTNETPEQRKARTAKAREAMAQKFPNDRARRKHYAAMARKRWEAKKAQEALDAQQPDQHDPEGPGAADR